jgi:hypothetical protein
LIKRIRDKPARSKATMAGKKKGPGPGESPKVGLLRIKTKIAPVKRRNTSPV